MKKIALLFMALVATSALWAYDFIVDGIAYYRLGGDSVKVTSKNENYTGSIVIPESVTYNSITYRVTGINACAFYKCSNLLSVNLPVGIKI